MIAGYTRECVVEPEGMDVKSRAEGVFTFKPDYIAKTFGLDYKGPSMGCKDEDKAKARVFIA